MEKKAGLPPAQLSCLPLKKCKWKKEKSLELLQIYMKYKTKLSNPSVENPEVWRKIANEVQQKCSLNCDASQCIDKIKQMRHEYETIKKKKKVSKEETVFFNEVKFAFESIDNSGTSAISSNSANASSSSPNAYHSSPNASNSSANISSCSSDVSNNSANLYSSSTDVSNISANVSRSSAVQHCKWRHKNSLRLIQVYAKYKAELSHPDVEEQTVWKKIAEEIKKMSSLNCDKLECRSKIDDLKCKYEEIKNVPVTNHETAQFLDEARKAFEDNENSVNFPAEQSNSTTLLKSKNNTDFHRKLLQVCAKYKSELSCSNTEESKVWGKISEEIREKFSYDCGESLCRFHLLALKSQYENFVKGKKVKYPNFFYVFDDARKVFEASENLDCKVNEINNNIGKYIPPHLRSKENRQDESKAEDRTYTIKVSNLPKDVTDSNLQALFRPFGTIARIYIIKDTVGQPEGFAFIKFHKQEAAIQAIQAVDGVEHYKLILKVELVEDIFKSLPASVISKEI